MSIELVMQSNYFNLCHPFLLWPSVFPSIRTFDSELALCIRWLKYWSYSFTRVISMNIQGWLPLGLTGLTSLQSKGLSRVQFSSVQSLDHVQLCHPMNCNMPCLPVHHQLPESKQTHVHWVGDAAKPSNPLPCPSPPALKLSQHQGLFLWVSSLNQVAKVLEFQLQHQSFQWTPRTDLL